VRPGVFTSAPRCTANPSQFPIVGTSIDNRGQPGQPPRGHHRFGLPWGIRIYAGEFLYHL
jgi:hypothetical protein